MLLSAVRAVIRILSYDMLQSARLPVDYPVEDLLLLRAASVKVDAGGFDALVSQNVREHGNVAALFDEVLGEQVPERMWVENRWIEIVKSCKMAQLHADTVGCDAVAIAV